MSRLSRQDRGVARKLALGSADLGPAGPGKAGRAVSISVAGDLGRMIRGCDAERQGGDAAAKSLAPKRGFPPEEPVLPSASCPGRYLGPRKDAHPAPSPALLALTSRPVGAGREEKGPRGEGRLGRWKGKEVGNGVLSGGDGNQESEME